MMTVGELELHAIVHGHVQGVFFRETTRRYAEEMGIVGTVANLSNGTVEIYAQGSKNKLEALLKELSGESGPGSVTSIEVSYSSSTAHFSDFQIVYK